MKNKNLVIIHHPGVYSIRDTFSGDQELTRGNVIKGGI